MHTPAASSPAPLGLQRDDGSVDPALRRRSVRRAGGGALRAHGAGAGRRRATRRPAARGSHRAAMPARAGEEAVIVGAAAGHAGRATGSSRARASSPRRSGAGCRSVAYAHHAFGTARRARQRAQRAGPAVLEGGARRQRLAPRRARQIPHAVGVAWAARIAEGRRRGARLLRRGRDEQRRLPHRPQLRRRHAARRWWRCAATTAGRPAPRPRDRPRALASPSRRWRTACAAFASTAGTSWRCSAWCARRARGRWRAWAGR